MIVQHSRDDSVNVAVIDETKPTKNFCPANVYFEIDSEQDNDYEYQPCGKPLRQHADGTLHCSTHGEMH
jgi:hypothetical protein